MDLIEHTFNRPDWERIESALHRAWARQALRKTRGGHEEALLLRRLWLTVRETVLGIKE